MVTTYTIAKGILALCNFIIWPLLISVVVYAGTKIITELAFNDARPSKKHRKRVNARNKNMVRGGSRQRSTGIY